LGARARGRERQAIQHQLVFAKSKEKLKISKEKLIYLGKKVSSKSAFEKQAMMTDRGPRPTLEVWGSPVTKVHLFF